MDSFILDPNGPSVQGPCAHGEERSQDHRLDENQDERQGGEETAVPEG